MCFFLKYATAQTLEKTGLSDELIYKFWVMEKLSHLLVFVAQLSPSLGWQYFGNVDFSEQIA